MPNEEEELAVDDLRPPSFSAVADRSDWLILLLLDVGGVVSGVSTTFGILKFFKLGNGGRALVVIEGAAAGANSFMVDFSLFLLVLFPDFDVFNEAEDDDVVIGRGEFLPPADSSLFRTFFDFVPSS